jgi:beta-glucosidase/6-phospho-beta-glucosidase/beta-galactosidase
MGCTAFRFSVAWARVEPEPGVFDDAVLDHYQATVEAIRAAGMEPVVTLVSIRHCHLVTRPRDIDDPPTVRKDGHRR